MLLLGVESSCDETSAAVVENGSRVLALYTRTQTEIHRRFQGVVPEIASRAHTEAITPVVHEALRRAGVRPADLDGVAVTSRPGLSGSLMVGFNFAKGFAAAANLPYAAVDHILAHAYAVQLEQPLPYPYVVLLLSGGHSVIGISRSALEFQVVGTTIDDACGEAFDKVAAFLGLGYPGGPAIERLAAGGNPRAFLFPRPRLHRANDRYDLSYSGLKTAVVHQLESFRHRNAPVTPANIAASFQRVAIELAIDRLENVCTDFELRRIGVGGGVAANAYLRERLLQLPDHEVVLPRLEYCVDNAAMVAGIGYHVLTTHGPSSFADGVSSRVQEFRHR